MGKSARDQFGDPRLVNGEIAPVPSAHRQLRARRLALVWAGVVVGPLTYAFAAAAINLSVVAALGALSGALLIAVGVAWVLTRTPLRYAVGFVVSARVAFGPRGALFLLILRWSLGVIWAALWAFQLGDWLRRYAIAALNSMLPQVGEWLTLSMPGEGGIAYATWAFAAGLLLAAWLVARAGIARTLRWLGAGLVVAAVSALALVVFAGIRSQGFGEWLQRAPPLGAGQVLWAVSLAALQLLPILICCPDWARFRRPDRRMKHPAARLAPMWMLPSALFFAFAGALLASAAHSIQGSFYAAPIADAGVFGGLSGGALGLLMAVAMWFAAVPLVGVYSPALALAGVYPKFWGFRRAVTTTAAASAFLALPVLGYVSALGIDGNTLMYLLAAPTAVLVSDELLVRRGNILLEEAYLLPSAYGSVLGVTFSSWLAVFSGWVWLPEIWRPFVGVVRRFSSAGGEVLATPVAEPIGVLGGALVAGLVYAALAPAERRAAAALKRDKGRRRSAGPELLNPKDDRVADATDGRFDYGPGVNKKKHRTFDDIDGS